MQCVKGNDHERNGNADKLLATEVSIGIGALQPRCGKNEGASPNKVEAFKQGECIERMDDMSIYLEQGVREGLDKVLSLGKQDDCEHLMIIRDGQEIHTFQGSHDEVKLHDRSLFKQGDILVHNHPGPLNSLSNMDFFATAQVGARWIYAITHDGSIYKGSLRSQFVDPDSDCWGVKRVAPLVVWQIEREYYALDGEIERSGDPVGLAHWLNLRLRNLGIIEYEYQLADETKQLINQINERNGLNKEW